MGVIQSRVTAYTDLRSRCLLVQARLRDGVLQICSAGAGTRYGPAGDFMRGSSEFFHFVLCALGEGGLRCDAIDEQGRLRRQLRWPLDWPPRGAGDAGGTVTPDLRLPETLARLHFDIEMERTDGLAESGARETLLCGHDLDEGPPTIRVGLERRQLVVEIVLWPGGPLGRWLLHRFAGCRRLSLDIVPDMGRGSVIARLDGGPPSSFLTGVAEDLDRVRWPRRWCLGHGPSGPTDEPFGGRVDAACTYAAGTSEANG